jgi:hypothetical protein
MTGYHTRWVRTEDQAEDPERIVIREALAFGSSTGTCWTWSCWRQDLVWPTAQAWVWEAAKTAFSWEKMLPAGLGLLSTCHVAAASAGDAVISAAAAPPATASSARRIFTGPPLLALAAVCLRARHLRTRTAHS